MNKAADRVVDKYWDRVIGKYYSGIYADSPDGSFPFALDSNVVLEDEYTFDRIVKMQIQTFNKKGKLEETMFMNSHSSDSEKYMGTGIEDEETEKSDQDIIIINDFKNASFVMLMRDGNERSRLAYTLIVDTTTLAAMEDAEMESENIATDFPDLTSLGTKTIMGKACKGYSSETEEGSMELWLTDEDIYGTNSIYNFSTTSYPNMAAMPSSYPTGSLMEVTTLDKASMEKTVMQVVDINKNASVKYKIADYPSASSSTK